MYWSLDLNWIDNGQFTRIKTGVNYPICNVFLPIEIHIRGFMHIFDHVKLM